MKGDGPGMSPGRIEPSHPHDPELIDCRECGSEFDLARQTYYDNTCPSCRGN